VSLHIFFDERDRPEEAGALRALAMPDEALVLGIDIASPAEALAELVAARRAGRSVAVFPVLDDPLEALHASIGEGLAKADPDARIAQVRALREERLMVAGKTPAQSAEISPAYRDAAALIVRLADVILLTTDMERRRWMSIANYWIRRTALLPIVPFGDGTNAVPGVTIYAPSTPAAKLAPLVSRLKARMVDPAVISSENARQRPGTTVVIAPEWWRPLRGLALASAGHRVVALAHGADERNSGIFPYYPHDYPSLAGALDAAVSSGAPVAKADAPPARAAQILAASEPGLRSGPLVSIIVRTFDRPALLARAVASIAAQTYSDVEIVVVNNGGADVKAIVEEAAGGRPLQYLAMPERRHIGAASNVGARAARGTYIGYLDDDDLLYADHCARLISTLESERADFAFGNCLGEYAEMDGDVKRVLGFQIFIDRDYDPEDIYIGNVAAIHSIVHRRDLFDRFGFFDESLTVTDDWEMWLRCARGGARIVHIDRTTCEYSWRYDPARGNMTLSHLQEFAHFYGVITQRYAADVADRPSIAALQAESQAIQRSRAEATKLDPSRARDMVALPRVVPAAPVPDPTKTFRKHP
jgi:hypothetical protein